jgi:hypothetical protein
VSLSRLRGGGTSNGAGERAGFADTAETLTGLGHPEHDERGDDAPLGTQSVLQLRVR